MNSPKLRFVDETEALNEAYAALNRNDIDGFVCAQLKSSLGDESTHDFGVWGRN